MPANLSTREAGTLTPSEPHNGGAGEGGAPPAIDIAGDGGPSRRTVALPLRVLLVEDSVDDAEMIIHELVRSGYSPAWRRVDAAPEFHAALSCEYDLIISDFELPQFDGLAALTAIRARGIETPFLLVTGTDGADLEAEVIRRGGSGFLVKSNLVQLGALIDRILRQAHPRAG